VRVSQSALTGSKTQDIQNIAEDNREDKKRWQDVLFSSLTSFGKSIWTKRIAVGYLALIRNKNICLHNIFEFLMRHFLRQRIKPFVTYFGNSI